MCSYGPQGLNDHIYEACWYFLGGKEDHLSGLNKITASDLKGFSEEMEATLECQMKGLSNSVCCTNGKGMVLGKSREEKRDKYIAQELPSGFQLFVLKFPKPELASFFKQP